MGVSKQMEFNPEIKYINDFAQFIPNEAIKNEPCSLILALSTRMNMAVV